MEKPIYLEVMVGELKFDDTGEVFECGDIVAVYDEKEAEELVEQGKAKPMERL